MILSIIAAWFVADALTGLVHWFIDKRLRLDGALRGIAQSNEDHHRAPTKLLFYTWSENINTSTPALLIALALYIVHAPLFLWLAFVFATFGNLVHRFAHTPERQLPLVVVLLQQAGIFQSSVHHSRHHRTDTGALVSRSEAAKSYCVMTDYLNPIVDLFL